jgi:hypothetical protein
MRNTVIVFFILFASSAQGQFAPAAGYAGSTAISKDTSIFVEWATGCSIQRGYKDIAVPDSGYTTIGDTASALGPAGQNGVVSLGDSGIATLTFQNAVFNGPGFDFAVFENGFYTGSPLAFLEFAFVEVSSDGNTFVRFPVTSNIPDTAQMAMTGVDCSLVNNLAGKYVFGYGTPFDLEELKNEPNLNVNAITHIRLIDVVGTINPQHATHDQYGHKINDPYPTAFASSGFDLDAVGVINTVGLSSVDELTVRSSQLTVYPNPNSGGSLQIKVEEELIGKSLKVIDMMGRTIAEDRLESQYSILNTQYFAKGVYMLSAGNSTQRLIIE